MKFKDILWLGLKGMSERRLRTALTVLSVMIGIAAIVALIALVSGVSASVTQSLQSIGPTTIILMPQGNHIFTAADIAEIEALPNVTAVIPILRFPANVTSAGTTVSATVYGINNYSLSSVIGGIKLQQGTLYTDSAVPTAVVGHDVVYPSTAQSATTVMINQPMYVTDPRSSKTITLIPVGILNTYGQSFFVSPDSSVFIPLQEAQMITGTYSYNMLLVQASNTSTVSSTDNLLTNIYGSEASIISVQSIANTISSVLGSLSLLLGAIAGISLLVAGISILSIMMVSVAERTHEIGILKSIGFKRRDILYLFLSEAMIIGLLGGIIGSAVGAGVSYGIAGLGAGSNNGAPSTGSGPATASQTGGASGSGHAVMIGSGPSGAKSGPSSSSPSSLSFTPDISPQLIGIAIFIAVFVSVLSSLYPAWKASTIDPITALRSE